MSASLEVEIVIFQNLEIVGFFDLASATLILYNYVLTLRDEIEYFWGVKWTGVTLLFFATRYLPFIDVGIFLTHQILDSPSPHLCSVLDHINGWSFMIGITVADIILMVRTWAIWNRTPRIAGVLVVIFLATFIPMYYCLYLFLNSVQFARDPLKEFTGCFISSASPILFGSYALLMAFETIIFTMTLVKAWRSHKNVQSTLLRTLYRDGLLFYFYLMAISILNVLVLIFAPREMANMLAFMHRTLHALLSGSILINLRRARADIGNGTEATKATNWSVARPESGGRGLADSYSFKSDSTETAFLRANP